MMKSIEDKTEKGIKFGSQGRRIDVIGDVKSDIKTAMTLLYIYGGGFILAMLMFFGCAFVFVWLVLTVSRLCGASN